MRRLALLALLGLAGCGGSSSKQAAAPPQPQLDPPQAAEPVGGPALKTTPPGKIVRVGAKPEGVAIDPVTHLAAVAVQSPNRLVLVDDVSGRIVRQIPLPGSARHVQFAPGIGFLAPAETANQLVVVDPRTGEAQTTAVGDHPHDATAVGTRIFTADEFGSTMTVVRAGAVVGTVPVDVQPGGIAAVGDTVAVVSVRAYDVELYGGESDRPRGLGAQSGGLGPSHVAVAANQRLVIADTRGHALMVYDTVPRMRFLARVPLAGTPVGMAADGNTVWVALTERAEAIPVDVSGAAPAAGMPIDTVRDPFSLAVDPENGRLAIASRSDGTLQLRDP